MRNRTQAAKKRTLKTAAMKATVDPSTGRDWQEPSSCAVFSISLITDIPYWQVIKALYMVSGGRHAWGQGWYTSQIYKALDYLGVEYEEMSVAKWEDRPVRGWYGTEYRCKNMGPTVAGFIRENPEDRWLFFCTGHVIGIRNGKTHHPASRHRGLQVALITAIRGKSL